MTSDMRAVPDLKQLVMGLLYFMNAYEYVYYVNSFIPLTTYHPTRPKNE